MTEVLIAVGDEQEELWGRYLADRSPIPEGRRSRSWPSAEPLDTAGALVAIRDRLAERFLVLNGDVILDVDPGMLMASPGRRLTGPADAHRGRRCLRIWRRCSRGVKVTAFVEKPDVTGDTRRHCQRRALL